MSQSCSNFMWRRFLAIVVVVAGGGSAAQAQVPQIGDTRVLPVINVALQIGSIGKESKRTTYSPPPGWYIRSHQVICIQRYGTSSYAVSTVPAGWAWNSEEQSSELHQRLTDLAAKAERMASQLKLNVKRDDSINDLLRANSAKHALILEANVSGEGLFRGGSGLQLQVIAEIVFVGSDGVPPSLGSPVVDEPAVRHVSGLK